MNGNTEVLTVCVNMRTLKILGFASAEDSGFLPQSNMRLVGENLAPPQINGMQSFMVCGWFKSMVSEEAPNFFFQENIFSGDVKRPPSQRCFTQHGYWILSQTFCYFVDCSEDCLIKWFQEGMFMVQCCKTTTFGDEFEKPFRIQFLRFLFQNVAQMASEKHVRYRFLVTKLVEGDKLSGDAMVFLPYTWV